MLGFPRPAPLVSGARVRLLAPSSPFDRARFDAGRALLARWDLSDGEALFERAGFLAGSDARRLGDVKSALNDVTIHGLIAARGGYGSTRLLPDLDSGEVRAANKWLVGFSDVTALHALWARAGLCSLHGAMVCSLPEAPSATQDEWFALLEGATPRPWRGLEVVRPGTGSGRLFGGNLTVLGALVGTPYFPPLESVVLALEDVAERPYRLDRTLTTMLQAGVLRGVRAIVLGQFTQCDPGPDGVSARDVLCERLSALRIPIVANAPFGHVADNRPLLFGAWTVVDGNRGELRFET